MWSVFNVHSGWSQHVSPAVLHFLLSRDLSSLDCSNTLKFPSIYHQEKVTSVVTKSECQMSLGKWIALIDVTEALLHPAWRWATTPSITGLWLSSSSASQPSQTFSSLFLFSNMLDPIPHLPDRLRTFRKGKMSNRSSASAWCFLLTYPENQLLPATGILPQVNIITDKVSSEPLFSFF